MSGRAVSKDEYFNPACGVPSGDLVNLAHPHGVLTDDRRAELQQHVNSCTRCATLLRENYALLQYLRAVTTRPKGRA